MAAILSSCTSVQPVSAHDISNDAFKHATAALEESTADILAQCQILERQASLLRTAHKDSQANAANTQQEELSRSIARQRAQLEMDIGQMGSLLASHVSTSSQQIDGVLNSLPDNAARVIEKDDRVLDGLQKLAPRLEADKHLQRNLDQIDILCKNYAAYECQAVFIRIDNIYREALKSAQTTEYNGNPHAEIAGLKLELEELYNEVNGLVQLIAEHQYRSFIHQALKQSHVEAAFEASRWSEYTAGVILYLTARLEALEELVKHARVHKAAMTTLNTSLESAMKERPRTDLDRNQHSSPIASKAGLKPLRLVQASFSQTQDQSAPLLKMLDINQIDVSSGTANRHLSDLLRTRSTANYELHRSSHEQITSDVAASLQRGQGHVNELLAAISTVLQDDQINLLDTESRIRLASFEKRTAITAEAMQVLDLEQLSDEVRNASISSNT